MLWIGGASGSGKTTVAWRLARRHGLRLYSADTRTWDHRDRALRAGSEAAHRWDSLTVDERWNAPAEELMAMSLHHERGPMVVEDLLALPASPLVVAEGTTLPPPAVTDGIVERSRVVWLLPSPEFFDAQVARRGLAPGPATLYRALAAEIERDAVAHGVPVLRVDGSAGVAELIDAVERRFADHLAAGPRAAEAAERGQLLREANEAIVHQVRGYHARPWASGDPDAVVKTFACECGDTACEEDVTHTVADAAAGPVLAPGHGPPR